jgi:hypothetical protein
MPTPTREQVVQWAREAADRVMVHGCINNDAATFEFAILARTDLEVTIAELTAQRDDLLAALRLIEPNQPFAGWENSEGEEIGQAIDAAIAKCNNKEK